MGDNSTKILQHWEGFVLEVKKETFTARLCPIFGEGGDLEAEIYTKYVKDSHIPEVGEVFDWKIGYENDLEFSRIEFRASEVWTQEQIEAAQKEAEALVVLFNENRL